MLEGSCLCGAVKYRIDHEVREVTHCHCSMCRKAHGAAFASYAGVPLEAFHLTEGADLVVRYPSSPGVTRTFCGCCGSTLQFIDERFGEIGVAAGTLDSPLGEVRQAHIFVDSRADWYRIQDDLPQHSGDL